MSQPSAVEGVVPLATDSARVASAAPAHSLRRVAGWLSALLADNGTSARFAAERRHDEGLVRRVEQQRRP
jgi:hypothetical protein